MTGREQEYVILASRWDHRWDVFVLDPHEGLIGATSALSTTDIRSAALQLLRDRALATHGPVRTKIILSA